MAQIFFPWKLTNFQVLKGPVGSLDLEHTNATHLKRQRGQGVTKHTHRILFNSGHYLQIYLHGLKHRSVGKLCVVEANEKVRRSQKSTVIIVVFNSLLYVARLEGSTQTALLRSHVAVVSMECSVAPDPPGGCRGGRYPSR